MKRILIAGLFVTGISLVVTSIGAWLAPDLLTDLPGGGVALFAAVFITISGLFGGKLTEWADTIFGKEKEDKPNPAKNNIEQQVNVDRMSGGVIAKNITTTKLQKPNQKSTILLASSLPPRQRPTSIAAGSKRM